MTKSNTLHGICRSRKITVRELSVLVGSQPSEIILASLGGAGSASLRQRIAEALGARCWEDLLHGSSRTVRTRADARLNMKRLVVLENEKPQIRHRAGEVKMYLFEGLYYVQEIWREKLIRKQFFDYKEAFFEFLLSSASAKEQL